MVPGRRIRLRFWLEMVLAAAGTVLIALTLTVPDWIEGLTGQDPDGGSGAAEWAVVVAVGAVTAVSALAARLEWRRRSALAARPAGWDPDRHDG
jgi:hypothetical protein